MGVNSLPKTVTRQRRDCDLNPGPSAPESSTLTTRLPSQPPHMMGGKGMNGAVATTVDRLATVIAERIVTFARYFPSSVPRRYPRSVQRQNDLVASQRY